MNKKISMKKMQELFDKTITEIFNNNYSNYDSVDRAGMHKILLMKGTRNFYFTVSLKFIQKYLMETIKNE